MNSPALQAIFAPPLAMLSFVYAFVMRVRAWFYHVGVLPSESSGAFVVSIGNLQAGGTGKTPVADFFVKRWRESVRLGIVSRGYGRQTKGSLRVDPAAVEAARKFGDEPAWLARNGTPVQVGERRAHAARDLIASEGLKLILLDDGFQHLALRRSFDIVLLDVTAPAWHWRVLPWGRLREPMTALRRADALILTKCESLSEEALSKFERHISRWAGSDRRYFEGKTRAFPMLRFQQRLSWPAGAAYETLVVAAGLANPSAFFKHVRSSPRAPKVVAEVAYPDHYEYTAKDVRELKARAVATGAKCVLVTEKDAVKLLPLWRTEPDTPAPEASGIELIVSKLEVGPARESDERLLEQIDEIILDQVRGISGGRGKLSARVPSP